MATDIRLKKKAGVLSSGDSETTYLTDLETGNVYELNETARLILDLLGEGKDRTHVEKVLAERYPDVPAEELQRDLSAVIDRFLRAGLVEQRHD